MKIVCMLLIVLSASQVTAQDFISKTVGEFVRVPAGEFQRNSNRDDVSYVSAFLTGRYEITQAQYRKLTGKNPSESKGDTLPVGNINFYDALVFCNLASIADGLSPVYTIKGSRTPKDWGKVPVGEDEIRNSVECDWSSNGYRLPTEMENAWAAMGATADPVNGTKGFMKRFAVDDGSNSMDDYCWHGFENNAGKRLHEVGTRKPNELGIYDISGNSTEWLWDLFEKKDPSGRLEDYRGPASGTGHIAAGGCWLSQDVYLRVYLPAEQKGALWSRAKFDYVGIRLAKNAE